MRGRKGAGEGRGDQKEEEIMATSFFPHLHANHPPNHRPSTAAGNVTLMHKYKDLPLLRGFPLAFRTGQFFAVGTVLCVEGCLAASLASVHEIRAASTSS